MKRPNSGPERIATERRLATEREETRARPFSGRARNHSCAPTEDNDMHSRQKMTPMQRLLAWLALDIAVVAGVGVCLLMTPAVMMSAGCCPGPSCGSGPATGSGSPEGCGSSGHECCAGKCNDSTLACTNPEGGSLSRCELCGGEGEACCDGMTCHPEAPNCTDVYSGGKYTCQSMAPPGAKPPATPAPN